MAKNYDIGLDIGTNSVGFVAIDDEGHLVRTRGKNVMGARLFKEGSSAAERRSFRSTRRRLNRRRYRLRYLQEFFEPYINEIDSTFFQRLKESYRVDQDPKKHFTGDILFPDKSDRAYYEQYPTIYHLRYHLMNDNRQFDLREVYLAIHQIIKYRGNFLNETPVNHFKVNELNLVDGFADLNNLWAEVGLERFRIRLTNLADLEKQLLDSQISSSVRARNLSGVFYEVSDDKEVDKQNKKIALTVLNTLLGLKGDYTIILNHPEISRDDKKDWSFSFNDADFDEKYFKLQAQLNENEIAIIETLKNLFMQITVQGILAFDSREIRDLPGGLSLSKAMMGKFADHQEHLAIYRTLIKQTSNREAASALNESYSNYINHPGTTTQDEFYSSVTKNLKKVTDQPKLTNQIISLIDRNYFMPKQRTKVNGAVPYQIQQQELDRIIEMQQKYYPWLAELNANSKEANIAKYKLDQLLLFRVPYYVGPLIEKSNSQNLQTKINQQFAWMVRRESGEITPYNFEQKVDRIASANQFIKRMTTTDTYLFGEDVLPDNSLIYQRYKVLNELNMLRINGKKISNNLKQEIFNQLFMKHKTVSFKRAKEYLVSQSIYPNIGMIKFDGVPDTVAFVNGLGTYYDFKKIFGSLIDNSERQLDFEKIIEWSTIFEDKAIFKQKLTEISWLTDAQTEKLLGMRRYSGWGRLSKKLLVGIKNSAGKSIMDQLWNDTQNFMLIQADPEYAEKIAAANQNVLQEFNDTNEIIDNMYTSPQNKKAIRQVNLVVADIVKAMKGVQPRHIYIEFPRGADKNPRRTTSRVAKIEELFMEATNQIDATVRQEFLQRKEKDVNITDRLYLYFMQNGRSMYHRNVRLDIDNLQNYDIDHILPQSFLKDNSLDNRVLVTREENRIAKDNAVPSANFKYEMQPVWQSMLNNGFITKRKYDNLMMNPEDVNPYQKLGFIHRQLVETRQVTKLVADLLAKNYADSKIVSIRAELTHEMRESFNLYKSRELNDYHHAQDAFLVATIGRYLLTRYPKLQSYFVYGEFKKFNDIEIAKKMNHFNFLLPLKNEETIADSETGEKLWDKHEVLAYIHKIFNYKKLLVSKETYTNNGNLFKMTVFPAPAHDTKKRKLIPIKNDRPIENYGGYTKRQDAFMAIVKDDRGHYSIKGIPVASLFKLQGIMPGSKAELDMIHEILTPQFTVSKKNKQGEITKKIKPFTVLVPRVPYMQLIDDDGMWFYASSSTYRQNAVQLVVSPQTLKTICCKQPTKKSRNIQAQTQLYDEQIDNQNLIAAYQEITTIVNSMLPLFDMNNFRISLSNGLDKFVEQPVWNQWQDKKVTAIGKHEVINRILIGLHNNSATSDLKILGIKVPFGFLQKISGELSPNSILVYKSPTGLFEHRLRLSDLG